MESDFFENFTAEIEQNIIPVTEAFKSFAADFKLDDIERVKAFDFGVLAGLALAARYISEGGMDKGEIFAYLVFALRNIHTEDMEESDE